MWSKSTVSICCHVFTQNTFSTATEIQITTIPVLVEILKAIKTEYVARGFIISAIKALNDFSLMKENPNFILLNMALNVTSKDEHKSFIERFNRTIKERCRMCFAKVPLKKYHDAW